MRMLLTRPIIICTLFILATSCWNKEDPNKKVFQTSLLPDEDPEFRSRAEQQRLNVDSTIMNLQLVSYQTRYSQDFVPTITFRVKNTGTKTVSSFEIQANLGSSNAYFNQCVFTKAFKQTIPPGESLDMIYTVSFDNLQSCNDYPVLELVREVCVDGTLNRKYNL